MNHRSILTAAMLLVTSAALTAGIQFQSSGAIVADETAKFGAAHYAGSWQPANQLDRSFKAICSRQKDQTLYTADWKLGDGSRAELIQSVRAEGKDSWLVNYRFSAKQPVQTNSLSLQMVIPAWSFFGKPVRLNDQEFFFAPETPENSTVTVQQAIRKIELPLKTGLLTIEPQTPGQVMLVDFRVFKQANFGLRLSFTPQNGKLSESELTFRLRFEPYRVEKLDLCPAINMGFVDEAADDRKGGWTDQGPTNDLRALKTNRVQVAPVTFEIVDPAKNGGKSCVVLGGGGRPYFPKTATIPAGNGKHHTLFLLHAMAWPPAAGSEIGTVTAHHKDGSRTVLPVISGRDIGNWWMPTQLKNGLIGWQGSSEESSVGLYLSRFELPGKPVDRIEFQSNGKAVWMIVGAAASPQRVLLAEPMSYRFLRNENWRGFANERKIEAGSALDFSFLLDAPAGKYGFVEAKGSQFEFEKRPGTPVRFYGANLCMWANFLTKAQCDELAERFSRIGYNAIRFHHFDRDTVKHLPQNTTTLNPTTIDQLDYLFAAMKKRGVYITLDLFTIRIMRQGEFKSAPWLDKNYKLAAMILPEVNANLKEYARQLLTRKNPYTGMTWAEDPALIGISLINENTIFHIMGHADANIRKVYDDKFEQWAKAKQLAVTTENRPAQYRRFLADLYRDYYDDMVKFMRSIGVRAPLTDQNYISTPNALEQRLRYDYVDNHMYWDHPMFVGQAWSLPVQFRNESVLKSRLKVPAELAPARVLGKPYTITEFDYCYPNRFRSEGATVFGAYAAMQNWSAIYRFAYSHGNANMFDRNGIETFDVVNDPVRLLTERIGMAFFTRFDVKTAEQVFPVAVSTDVWKNYAGMFPLGAQELSLLGRTGSVEYDGNGKFTPALPAGSRAVYSFDSALKNGAVKLPVLTGVNADAVLAELKRDQLLPVGTVSRNNQIIRSLTGELTANFEAGSFLAVTPCSEAAVLPEGRHEVGQFLEAQSRKNFAVVAAIAVDGKTLKDSSRILLLHVTDVQEEGARFSDQSMSVKLENAKSGKLLAAKGVADFTIHSAATGWKLYALSFTGHRLGEVPFRQDGDKLKFTADTFFGKQVVFAYELTR